MLLRTNRLLLREFVESDWRAVLEYQSDPSYLWYYPWVKRTARDVQAFVGRFISWQKEQPRMKYQLAIVLAEEQRLVGTCGIRMANVESREAELGYEIAPAYWGRGLATEAAGEMLRVGFEELGLHRIWAACLQENAASARVLEKLGVVCEGHLRQNKWMKGRWWDTLLYAILEHEWRGNLQGTRITRIGADKHG